MSDGKEGRPPLQCQGAGGCGRGVGLAEFQ